MADREQLEESAIGGFDETSFELDIHFDELPPTYSGETMLSRVDEIWPTAGARAPLGPDLVVYDPMGFQIATGLTQMRYPLRVALSAVDVMEMVAAKPTAAVLCGPAADAETHARTLRLLGRLLEQLQAHIEERGF